MLVVEDDASLRMLCRINLELEGYRVLEAETIDRADELVASEPVDVVLLDLHVGERHGMSSCRSCAPSAREAAVCLLSGTSEADPPRRGGRATGSSASRSSSSVLTETVRAGSRRSSVRH